MKELSLHILDIVQNSIHANATEICIEIYEETIKDKYTIGIRDNGDGMNVETLASINDPFFTTKNKKTGLGIPLLRQHAEMTGGEVNIESELGKGTKLKAVFGNRHIDRQPMGDIVNTLTGLIRSNPSLEFMYQHKVDEKVFVLSTIEIKKELEDTPISSNEIIVFLNELIQENLKNIGAL